MITHRSRIQRRDAMDEKSRRASFRAAAALAVIVLAALLGIGGEPSSTTERGDAIGLQREHTPLPAMLEDAYRREMLASAAPTGHYEGKRIVDYVTYG